MQQVRALRHRLSSCGKDHCPPGNRFRYHLECETDGCVHWSACRISLGGRPMPLLPVTSICIASRASSVSSLLMQMDEQPNTEQSGLVVGRGGCIVITCTHIQASMLTIHFRGGSERLLGP